MPYASSYFTDQQEAHAMLRKAFRKIGEPFTIGRFEDFVGPHRGRAIASKWGWANTLRHIGIPVASRGPHAKFRRSTPPPPPQKHPRLARGAATASVAGKPPLPRPTTSTTRKGTLPKWELYDRSTVHGFKNYMAANPVYYTELTGRRCTPENIAATCSGFVADGLVSRTGLKLTCDQCAELQKIKRGPPPDIACQCE